MADGETSVRFHLGRFSEVAPVFWIGSIWIRLHKLRVYKNGTIPVARYDRPLFLAMASPGEGVLETPRYAELHRALPPVVRYVEFPGAGHSLHRSALNDFSAALDAFLAA